MEAVTKPGLCQWCSKRLPSAGQGTRRLFCDDTCRQRYKRAERAATLGELVEALGPHVDTGGIEIYKELVDHLAGKINADA